ncbi:hypothetical protein RHIZO_04437 [Rhizobiaceae bacterium]|nr:hypothetical protein RHIZO_04437 [Rhizobiaceae bacterium]
MNGATDGGVRNEPMLLRIAALLVTLSLAAERAAGRSLPVRFLVLAILRRAESVATAFAVREVEALGASEDDFPWLDDAPESGSSPLDAAFLALRFRALAEVLELCCAAWRYDDTAGNGADIISGDCAPHPATRFPILLLVFPARRGLPVHDTS